MPSRGSEMDQAQYTIAILQQQRNQAFDALADAVAQLNVMRDQLALAQSAAAESGDRLIEAQAEIERLHAASKAPKGGFDTAFDVAFNTAT